MKSKFKSVKTKTRGQKPAPIQTRFKKVETKNSQKNKRSGKPDSKRPSTRTVPVLSKKKPEPKKPLVSTLKPGMERLEKHMAQSGMSSRREAKDLVHRGLVTVNGTVVKNPGFGIDIAKDKIKISGGVQESKETVLFYKPRGIETSKTSPDSIDIHARYPKFAHLAPIGRLDKDTEGLILLSNDGVLAKVLTGENSTVEKEYLVTTREDVMPVLLKKMEDGIMLDKIRTKPCKTEKKSRNEYTITLTEGRKHQVRRMADACKLTVTKLKRIRIGHMTVGKMTAGNFKRIPDYYVQEMRKD
jgi:pseudouridine synthase